MREGLSMRASKTEKFARRLSRGAECAKAWNADSLLGCKGFSNTPPDPERQQATAGGMVGLVGAGFLGQ